MTCEVVVANRMGVALAADSAATFDDKHIASMSAVLPTRSSMRPEAFQILKNDSAAPLPTSNANGPKS
ncbi:hypothetical protein FOB72_14970 [Cupriavidus pauculus]|uniref:Uncharacterized protein n=1 Tax=Cupriavidus pauculus TaxID=82633 RepID=A0A5P2H801_9BURK|nr:hypothetical protein [Cupriavidus pauculus]QET03220.1 hypothetical protein FOB72_14970 [Cupriavidus pauculus]